MRLSGLCDLLLQEKWAVTILFTQRGVSIDRTQADSDLRIISIDFLALMPDLSSINLDHPRGVSYLVYRYLKKADFETVHFLDRGGAGFYASLARSQRLFRSIIFSHIFGNSHIARMANFGLPSVNECILESMERIQLENSDIVCGATSTICDWYTANDYHLPRAVYRPLPISGMPESKGKFIRFKSKAISSGELAYLIFVGTHDYASGFDLFIDAICALPSNISLSILFIGSFRFFDGEHSAGYALRKLASSARSVQFLTDVDDDDVLDVAKRYRNALVVLASRIENNLHLIVDLHKAGIPCLITDVARVKNVLVPSPQSNFLVQPTMGAIKAALIDIFESGRQSVCVTLSPNQIMNEWTALIDEMAEPPADRLADQEFPLVSIVLVHHDRPDMLLRAISYIEEQTYKNLEVIVVDDGSILVSSAAALSRIESGPNRFNTKVIRSSNSYLGAARNIGVRASSGTYIYFHDDDNVAMANAVETFVLAAQATKADVVTAMCHTFEVDPQEAIEKKAIAYYPIGHGGVFSYLENTFGDANALVRRSAFELIGGFSEIVDVGLEDWEFFLRAYIEGLYITTIPEPIFLYRLNAMGMRESGSLIKDYSRILLMIDDLMPRIDSTIFRIAQKEYIMRAMRGRALARLEADPFSLYHQDLSALNPESPLAWPIIERLQVAMEDNKKPAHHPIQSITGDGSGARNEGEVAGRDSQKVTCADAVDILYVRGWCFDRNKEGISIALVRFGGDLFTTVKQSPIDRPDVDREHVLGKSNVGFEIFLRPDAKRRLHYSYFRHKRISFGGLERGMFEVIFPSSYKVTGHVDAIVTMHPRTFVLRERSCSVIVDIETERARAPFLLYDGSTYIEAEYLGNHRCRFTVEKRDDSFDTMTLYHPISIKPEIRIIYLAKVE